MKALTNKQLDIRLKAHGIQTKLIKSPYTGVMKLFADSLHVCDGQSVTLPVCVTGWTGSDLSEWMGY